MDSSRFKVSIPGRSRDVNGNTLSHERKVPSPSSINYIPESGLWRKSIAAFETSLSTVSGTDRLESSKVAEEVRLLLNSWSGFEFYSVVPCSQLLFYGGPYLFIKVDLTRLSSSWQSWQIDVNYQIVSDQVTDNLRKKNELNRHTFFLVAITNR